MADVLLREEFLVAPAHSKETIIGTGTMQKWWAKLDFGQDMVQVDSKLAKMRLI
jgi:hypothetical protein